MLEHKSTMLHSRSQLSDTRRGADRQSGAEIDVELAVGVVVEVRQPAYPDKHDHRRSCRAIQIPRLSSCKAQAVSAAARQRMGLTLLHQQRSSKGLVSTHRWCWW